MPAARGAGSERQDGRRGAEADDRLTTRLVLQDVTPCSCYHWLANSRLGEDPVVLDRRDDVGGDSCRGPGEPRRGGRFPTRLCDTPSDPAFGAVRLSIAGEDTPASDIDLLVEFEEGHAPGLLGMAEMELELGSLLGREVELRTYEDLSRYFRDDVRAQARVLYAT